MHSGDAEGRAERSGAAWPPGGRKSPDGGDGASRGTARRGPSGPETMQLMGAVVERGNMQAAWKRVKGNQGAAGVDGMDVSALPDYRREHWPRIKAELLAGRYAPSPVRLVEIPKPGGGLRPLGIPTVLDRLIQQALHQVMQPLFDPDFSKSSYGFRPGRSAWQAVAQAREYVAGGRRWEVDLDLEKFFDRVTTCCWPESPVRLGINGCCASFAGFFQPGSWRGAWYRPASRGRRRAGRCRRYCPTSCWMIWIGNWPGVAIPSAATPTIAMCMCGLGVTVSG